MWAAGGFLYCGAVLAVELLPGYLLQSIEVGFIWSNGAMSKLCMTSVGGGVFLMVDQDELAGRTIQPEQGVALKRRGCGIGQTRFASPPRSCRRIRGAKTIEELMPWLYLKGKRESGLQLGKG